MKRRTFGSEVRTNEEKLAELQDELQEARMGEEIVRTRGEIYACIIHDINGPLTVISGLLQIINQGILTKTKIPSSGLVGAASL